MTELDVSQMTPEQRLKQIEVLLSTAAKAINLNTETIKSNSEAIKSNSEAIKSNSEAIQTIDLQLTRIAELVLNTSRIVAQQQTNMEILQAESRRSQAEIERIWQYLMSRTGNGNSP